MKANLRRDLLDEVTDDDSLSRESLFWTRFLDSVEVVGALEPEVETESSDKRRALFDFLGLCRVLYGFSENLACLRSGLIEVFVISGFFFDFC